MAKSMYFWCALTGADKFPYEAHFGLEEWELIQQAIKHAMDTGPASPLNDHDRGLLADILTDMEENAE